MIKSWTTPVCQSSWQLDGGEGVLSTPLSDIGALNSLALSATSLYCCKPMPALMGNLGPGVDWPYTSTEGVGRESLQFRLVVSRRAFRQPLTEWVMSLL